MICTNCNAVNDSESVFCVNCGNAVTGGSVSSMPRSEVLCRANAFMSYSIQTLSRRIKTRHPDTHLCEPNKERRVGHLRLI